MEAGYKVKDVAAIAKCEEKSVSVAIEEIKPEDWAETGETYARLSFRRYLETSRTLAARQKPDNGHLPGCNESHRAIDFHLKKAFENGLTKEELVAAITHIAFYAGWPTAASGFSHLKKVLDQL